MVTVGVVQPEFVAEAIRLVRKDGIVVVTSAGNYQDSMLPINLLEFTMSQKKLKGALFGQASPNTTIPWLVDMYIRGHLKLDEMITRRYSLDQIAEAYDDLKAGKLIRSVVDFAL
jgi:S-(hydroxymethyl)glutathione dehydrogenase/alcohol dehydrogenase